MNDPQTSGFLPSSIEEVLAAVEHLEETLHGVGFPNLSQPPANDQAVAAAVGAAADWARGVQRAYGAGERQRRYKGAGVLPFFKPGSGFNAHDDDPVTLLGALPDEYIVAELIGRDLTYFEYAFSHAREPHLGQARSLTDPGERDIAFSVANWSEIRRRLMLGYARIVKRVLGLTAWIRTRVRELEGATMPRIEGVGKGSHNRIKLRVSQALSDRELEVTHMQAQLLRGLAKGGTATASRRTKMDLLNLIPELRPWIENRAPDPKADVANEATYGVAPEVQELIQLGE